MTLRHPFFGNLNLIILEHTSQHPANSFQKSIFLEFPKIYFSRAFRIRGSEGPCQQISFFLINLFKLEANYVTIL